MARRIQPSQSSSQQDASTTELLHLSGLPVGQKLIPECEVIFEGEGDRLEELFDDCEKNPGHPNFIPVKKFGFEHLPRELRSERMMRILKNNCNRTVRIVVRFTSEGRPDKFSDNKSPYPYSYCKGSKRAKRYGTGFIIDFHRTHSKVVGRCPCPPCQKSREPKMMYWKIVVQTATHVIYDDSEAVCSEFDCFYDTDNDPEAGKLYGLHTIQGLFVPGTYYKSDFCNVMCVSHEWETVKKISKAFTWTLYDLYDYHPALRGVIISHPHGCSKRITVGNFVQFTYIAEDPTDKMQRLLDKNTICRLPMKPWISDKLYLKSLPDEERHQTYMDKIKILYKTHFKQGSYNSFYTSLTLPFMKTKSMHSSCEEKDIYNIIIAIACGFYKFVKCSGFIFVAVRFINILDLMTNYLVCQRLYNKTKSNTKLELIDVGLLLWKCYFIIFKELLKDLFVIQEETPNIGNKVSIMQYFIENIYKLRSELLPMFDLRLYFVEKVHQYSLPDYLYSDLDEMKKAAAKILIGRDLFTEKDENIDDDNNNLFHEFVIWFFNTVDRCFTTIDSHRKLICENKTLTTLESDDFLKPGTNFLLPSEMTFTLPTGAEFLCKYYKGNPDCFIFPPGTTFHIKHGIDLYEFPLPDDAEFFTSGDNFRGNYFMAYDMDTCPGSSGAFLFSYFQKKHDEFYQVHSGSVGNMNRSGIGSREEYLVEEQNINDYIQERYEDFLKLKFQSC